ncbi:class II 3-deoxy-7-phosphoheptulonate synthase [Nigerium massiliense]|uniref:class II 3-deoxy-7-phosphoheptulonate synthase n=1 Tax=Nigerium massiliense TaxID=1522317 RepID=UPI00058B41A8|nr:3-deoxy-7-phosphoheptulonate synthase class II [Nigerium massiliense]
MSDLIPTLEHLRSIGAAQQPTYPDAAAVGRVVAELRRRPPLVFAGEADALKSRLAEASAGRAFLLQAGDCAETFSNVRAASIRDTLRVQLSMAMVLQYAAQVPVVKVGRIAGQYAKPRSSDTETRDDVTLPSYRGDAVNGLAFTPEDRVHDPKRLVEVYNMSAATLNLVRAFVQGGFADLRSLHSWNSAFVRNSNVEARYEALSAEIERALAFMVACGVDDEAFHTIDFYASHEALLMEYEQALTRIDSRTGLPYGTSGHMLWIGERTRQLDGAHIDLLRRLRNPLGLKVGPKAAPEDVVALADALDADHEPGRLTVIARMGAGKVRDALPAIIEGVEASGHEVVWVCDPMHGNTFSTSNGFKTRAFDQVLEEVNGFFDVHEQLGTWPGGIHIELTGSDVTECVGGVDDLAEQDLSNRYETACDPRLNRNQSLELAFYVAERLNNDRIKRGSNPVQAFEAVELA